MNRQAAVQTLNEDNKSASQDLVWGAALFG
jgi:hypothetical protein